MVEHHAASEQGRGDRDGVGEGLVLDGAGDGVGVQLDVYAAGEPQGAASGEGAGTEDAAEVLGRERRRHGRGVTSRGKWVPSWSGRRVLRIRPKPLANVTCFVFTAPRIGFSKRVRSPADRRLLRD